MCASRPHRSSSDQAHCRLGCSRIFESSIPILSPLTRWMPEADSSIALRVAGSSSKANRAANRMARSMRSLSSSIRA